jgi:hypothetical protein
MEVDPHLPGAAYAARPLHQRRFGETIVGPTDRT